MRKFLNVFLCLGLFGCSSSTFHLGENDDINSIKHSYNEVEKYVISWTDCFTINLDEYYIYCYSRTCAFCNDIKNEIIEFALTKENMFFIEFEPSIPIIEDVDKTIGSSSLLDVGIKGTPSLILIQEGMISKNLAGSKEVLEEIRNTSFTM